MSFGQQKPVKNIIIWLVFKLKTDLFYPLKTQNIGQFN